MKIHVVTGATGFVGRYLIRDLLQKGEHVWVVVRPLHQMSGIERGEKTLSEFVSDWPDTFTIVEGDITLENFGLAPNDIETLRQNDIVLWHLAANLSFASEDRKAAVTTNRMGTVHAVHLANHLSARYMHMSTAYVCGDAHAFKETDLNVHQTFRNHYEQSKFEGESYVREQCTVPYTILRPSIIIGDAYRGKAEGCTFGYYRYMFMFHFFKQNIMRYTRKHPRLMRWTGTRYDAESDTLHTPWLVIPYPKHGQVDLITVDYIVDSMSRVYEKNIMGTAHLTHHNAPTFHFVLQSVLEDIGYRRIKLIPVPTWVFRVVVSTFYFVGIPIRKYARSVMWYIPYVSEPCLFERKIVESHLENPPEISRDVIRRINTYAKEHILDYIDV